jgi:hypothetical protein
MKRDLIKATCIVGGLGVLKQWSYTQQSVRPEHFVISFNQQS